MLASEVDVQGGTPVMVYSHWLTPEPEQGTGTRTGKMGCMRLYRTFHITQEPGPESGPEK